MESGHNLRWPALMQTEATATTHTDHFMNANAFDQGCVRQEETSAVLAVLQIPVSVLFHLANVHPPVRNAYWEDLARALSSEENPCGLTRETL